MKQMSWTNICGADFSTADLGYVKWDGAKFDEHTKFPTGFVPNRTMMWLGNGPHPGLPKLPKATALLDIPGLLRRLEDSMDASKIQNALSMLKTDRFNLFAEVSNDRIVGVIKSQSNRELVYSCTLAADGRFGCCTQNLKVCGGLNRQLCKHLVVLIIGLIKSEKLSASSADEWIQTSLSFKPALDKPLMSETFLRYKGAEAGEIDWRPIETIPEDYYSF